MNKAELDVREYKDSQWIKSCEEAFAKSIFDIAEDIYTNRRVRVIRLFGPSCSGKTTTARHIISCFKRFGKRAHVISIDDFFYNRETLAEMSREKGLASIDYDSPDTIDCEELESFIKQIFNETTVRCPRFDFKSGMRAGYRTMTVDDDDIFIFEGIQAVYPNVVEMFGRYPTASVYIFPQKDVLSGGACFEPNEIRLMRRLVRDYNFRATDPATTFSNWDGVRDNEEKNIFPFVKNTDYTVNSSMPYEIGVLKPFLEKLLSEFDSEDAHFSIASHILERITLVEPISDKLILDGYLYKEFV